MKGNLMKGKVLGDINKKSVNSIYQVCEVNNSGKYLRCIKVYSNVEKAIVYIDNYTFNGASSLQLSRWYIDSNQCPELLYERIPETK